MLWSTDADVCFSISSLSFLSKSISLSNLSCSSVCFFNLFASSTTFLIKSGRLAFPLSDLVARGVVISPVASMAAWAADSSAWSISTSLHFWAYATLAAEEPKSMGWRTDGEAEGETSSFPTPSSTLFKSSNFL